jgi:protein Mpv17
MSRTFLTNLFQHYNYALTHYPLRTKSLTGATLSGTGDLFAQYYERQNKQNTTAINPARRFIVFTAFGALWTGPFNHYWLGLLAQKFPASLGAKGLVAKLSIHHFWWNPFVYFPVFFGFNGLFRGLSWEEFVVWVKRDYWSMLVWCWIVWIPITAWVFTIPIQFQSVIMSFISLAWNSFLSWKSNKENAKADIKTT